jgi:hypothetical protein
MTDVTSGSTEQQYSQSNDEESYYILKTNNPFLFENLYTVMYFMQYSHCYCCLGHVNRIHTCNTINILIGHQLFNDDFFYKWWEMFYYIVSDKNGEMYQRSYSVINRRRSLVDDQQLLKFINIFQPGSRLVRLFIFNLQLL